VALLAAFVVAALLVMRRVARFPVRRFLADYALYVYPFAWATASSAATIPINLERVGLGLGVRREVRDLLVPVGATLNRPGSMTSAVILTVVAAMLLGVRPGALDLLVLLLPLTLVIVAAPSVPAGTAVVAPPVILSVLPIPPEAHAAFAALFFAFGVGLTDQFRTGVNAIGTGLLCVLYDKAWPRFAGARQPMEAGEAPRAPSALPRRAPPASRVRSLPREP
jgi:Na+/H+-dicarboxylate symporter